MLKVVLELGTMSTNKMYLGHILEIGENRSSKLEIIATNWE